MVRFSSRRNSLDMKMGPTRDPGLLAWIGVDNRFPHFESLLHCRSSHIQIFSVSCRGDTLLNLLSILDYLAMHYLP